MRVWVLCGGCAGTGRAEQVGWTQDGSQFFSTSAGTCLHCCGSGGRYEDWPLASIPAQWCSPISSGRTALHHCVSFGSLSEASLNIS